MPTFPNRCQHIKVNGTQCGCPALRRNQLCYFHKRHHDERVQLNLDRMRDDRVKDGRIKAARRRPVSIDLPVLEDANSIQVSLMQIMRLILTGEVDGKTAGLLLYALQTASSNLARTTFEPNRHEVILNPAAAHETMLGESVWEDEDFEEEDGDEAEEDEIDPAKAAGIRKAAEFLYRLDAENAARRAAKSSAAQSLEKKPLETKPCPTKPSENPPPPRKPAVPVPTSNVARQVSDQIRQALPDLVQTLQAQARDGS